MPGGTPEDFIEKVGRNGIKVRGIGGPALVQEGTNVVYLKGKKPKILEGTTNKVCTITGIILEEPETHSHGIKKRILLEGCGDERFNPENFKIAI